MMQIKNLTDAQIMIKIIEWMVSETKNQAYHEKLNKIIEGLKSKRWMESENNPQIKSMVLFGYNLFPFEMKDYREMAKLL